MPLIGMIEEISRMGTDELSVEWGIPNFPLLLDLTGKWYGSPVFRMGNERWRLSMCPTWKREEQNPASGWVRLDLVRLHGGPPETFRFSVAIRGFEGVEKIRERVEEFSGYGSYSLDDFCSRSELMAHRSRLMPNGAFTIRCVLKRSGVSRDASTQTDCNLDAEVITGVKKSTDKRDSSTPTVEEAIEDEVPAEVNQSSEKQGGEKALEDFGALLASGENNDATVQVGGVEFKVHSAILFARSPALSVSLRHDSKERASNKILIEDTEPEAFREYLQYLYTGSVRSLTEQNVFHLYRTADKYLAEDLKLQCLKHMRNTLSVRTFCNTLKLALTHGESDLLERALDFAKENIQLIIVSVEWQNFICEHPREANEIFVKCFGPRT